MPTVESVVQISPEILGETGKYFWIRECSFISVSENDNSSIRDSVVGRRLRL